MKKTEPALWGADRKVCNDAAQYPEYTLGRILSQEKDLYRMITAEGECVAKVSGIRQHILLIFRQSEIL